MGVMDKVRIKVRRCACCARVQPNELVSILVRLAPTALVAHHVSEHRRVSGITAYLLYFLMRSVEWGRFVRVSGAS